MKWFEIRVESGDDITESLSALFLMNGIENLLLEGGRNFLELENSEISWDYVDETLMEESETGMIYKGHIEMDEEEREGLLNVLKKGMRDMGISYHTIDMREIDANEGVDKWKEYFKPFLLCENIVVCPSWENYKAEKGEQVLLMDPGSAFGTGTHESTALCAEFLAEYVKGGESLLDIGCGSGVLSIVGLLKGAAKAKALDVDELAVSASIENAEKNKVSNRMFVSLDEDYGSGYDIIVSNLTTPTLIELSDRIKKATKSGTYFICSGILTEGKDRVISLYTSKGFELLEDRARGEWTGLVFRV